MENYIYTLLRITYWFNTFEIILTLSILVTIVEYITNQDI